MHVQQPVCHGTGPPQEGKVPCGQVPKGRVPPQPPAAGLAAIPPTGAAGATGPTTQPGHAHQELGHHRLAQVAHGRRPHT